MSDRPNPTHDPFDRPGEAPHQFGGAPQQGSSRIWLWVLGTVGVLVVLAALVCCGGGYFVWQFGSEALARSVREDLQGNPVIEEHIGEIESVQMNLQATAQEQENVPNSITFDIEGTQGEGRLVVLQQAGAEGTISSAVLVLPDGTRHQVLPLEGEPAETPETPAETPETPAETPETPAETPETPAGTGESAEVEPGAAESGAETTEPQPQAAAGSNS